MRDGSVMTVGRDEKVWRAWPDGRTLLINDPNFVQDRMDFFGKDEIHPDAKIGRFLFFAGPLLLLVLVGLTVILIEAAII